jgi:hypothetical protein
LPSSASSSEPDPVGTRAGLGCQAPGQPFVGRSGAQPARGDLNVGRVFDLGRHRVARAAPLEEFVLRLFHGGRYRS